MNAISSICIVTAIDVEFQTVGNSLSDRSYSSQGPFACCRGRYGAKEVTVFRSEMGAREFAPWLADHLAANSHDALLVIGLAGGLNPKLKPGEVVIYDRCHRSTPESAKEIPFECEENVSISCDPDLVLSLSRAIERHGIKWTAGSGLTVDEVLLTAESKIAAGQKYEASAVDMESHGLLQVARQTGIPAGVLRVISDDATMDLPDFARAMTPDGRIRPWRLAKVLAARPAASAWFLLTIGRVMGVLRNAVRAALSV